MNDLSFDIVELVACPIPLATGQLREMAFRADAWSPDERQTLVLAFKAGEPFGDVAERMGRTMGAIRQQVCDMGLRRNTRLPWTELEAEELQRLYGEVPASTVAALLGRPIASIYVKAAALGLTEGNAPRYSAWEDAQIRAGYDRGAPMAQIAALIGRPVPGMAGRAHHLGLHHPNKPADWSAEEAARALELVATGMIYSKVREQMAAEGFPPRSKPGFSGFIFQSGYRRGWGRPWTEEEEDAIRLAYAEGRSLTPVLELLGRARTSIRWKVEELGLQGRHPKPGGFRLGPVWSEEETAFLQANYATMTSKAIAERLGRNVGGVQQRAWALGLLKTNYKPISSEEKRAIQVALDVGLTLGDLAAAFGRDVAVVHRTAKRMGLRFSERPQRVARGPRSKRPTYTVAQILALGQHAVAA